MKKYQFLCKVMLSWGVLSMVMSVRGQLYGQAPLPIAEDSDQDLQQQSAKKRPIAVIEQVIENNDSGAEVTTEIEPVVDSESIDEGKAGNWRKKKHWLIKSRELLDQVGKLVNEIESMQDVFHARYQAIDGELDAFYSSMYLEQGKLSELIASIDRHLGKKQKRAIDALMNQEEKLQERDAASKIEQAKEETTKQRRALEQFKLDLEAIEELDKSLTTRLEKVKQEVEKVSPLSIRAKEIVESLWKIVDHNEARTRYFTLEGEIIEKLSSIKSFLSDTLLRDFDEVIRTIRAQIKKVRESSDNLEEQGLIIKNRMQRVEELRIKKAQEEEVRRKEEEQVEREKIAAQKIVKKKIAPSPVWYEAWYTSSKQLIAGAYDWLASWFGKKASASIKKVKQLSKQVEVENVEQQVDQLEKPEGSIEQAVEQSDEAATGEEATSL